jgi:hypothetical protein
MSDDGDILYNILLTKKIKGNVLKISFTVT